MDFAVYDNRQILSDEKLVNWIIDLTVDNLSYIYGSDMGNEEDRQLWTENNLKDDSLGYKAVIASKNDKKLGFLSYTIDDRILTVHDIEISKDDRFNPILLLGLFRKVLYENCEKYDGIKGYINKQNKTSMDCFLKYASEITERPRGFSFTIDEYTKNRICRRLSHL